MLEYMLKRELGDSYHIESAGIGAVRGGAAHPLAQDVMAEHGYDLSLHAGRQVMAEMLTRNDLVLALDAEHVRWIQSNFPESRGRVYLSGHWSNGEEVPDPVREPIIAFENVYIMLQKHVASWKAQL